MSGSETSKGALAGACGGIAGALAMSALHLAIGRMGGSHQQGDDSTVKAAEKVAGHKLSPEQKKVAGPAVHLGFGGVMGAAYGAAAELSDVVEAGAGVPFGLAIWAGAHMAAVPALGLAPSPLRQPLRDEAGEFAAHVVYGLVTEAVRRALRKVL